MVQRAGLKCQARSGRGTFRAIGSCLQYPFTQATSVSEPIRTDKLHMNRPYDYGSAAKPDNLIDVEKPGAGLPFRGKSDRRRLNLLAIVTAVLLPWL
eukprot:1852650-Amphidinium_carterae.1